MRKAFLAVASFSVVLLGAQSVCADQITTTTTERTTAGAAMPLVPVQPDARATLIYGTTGGGPTTISTYKSNEFGGPEQYAKRLAKMLDQINLGLDRGYISASQADRLKAKYSDLSNQEQQCASNGFTKDQTDVLEKNMNVFNVEVSHMLSDGARTAGAGVAQ